MYNEEGNTPKTTGQHREPLSPPTPPTRPPNPTTTYPPQEAPRGASGSGWVGWPGRRGWVAWWFPVLACSLRCIALFNVRGLIVPL